MVRGPLGLAAQRLALATLRHHFPSVRLNARWKLDHENVSIRAKMPSKPPNTSNSPIATVAGTSCDFAESKLLQLPRELRDMIYNYALYQPSGLFYYRDQDYKSHLCASADTQAEFNQLKYTCRQLRQETVGLELKLQNDVVFLIGPDRKGLYVEKLPAVQFLGFLDMCHETWRRRIHRVFLRSHHPPNHQIQTYDNANIFDLHLLVRLCHNYPNFLLFWEYPLCYSSGQQEPSSFLSDGLMFELGFRSNSVNRKRVWRTFQSLNIQVALGCATIYQSMWRRDIPRSRFWQSQYREPSLEAPNFRVLPPDGPFDEDEFRHRIDTWVENFTPRRAPTTTQMKEGWVALARKWYTEGI